MKKKEEMNLCNSQQIGLLTDICKEIRQKTLNNELKVIEDNYNNCLSEMDICKESVNKIMSSNRGGIYGMHGFIGEAVQVHVSNANNLLEGKLPEYLLLDDNGPTDYLRGNIHIQQKACQSDGLLGLTHIKKHAKIYPIYIEGNNNIYQIPCDFYNKYNDLLNTSKPDAGKLLNTDYKLWKKINDFKSEFPNIKIEPMVVTYDEIQVGSIEETIDKISKQQRNKYNTMVKEAHENYKPSLSEFSKLVLISTVTEGSIHCLICISSKIVDGKSILDFTYYNWKDVIIDTTKGIVKGAIRGSSTYILTNYVNIPGPLASASITSVFIVTKEYISYTKQENTKNEAIDNCLNQTKKVIVSTVSTYIGSSIISKLLPPKYRNNKAIKFISGSICNVIGLKIYGFLRTNPHYIHP